MANCRMNDLTLIDHERFIAIFFHCYSRQNKDQDISQALSLLIKLTKVECNAEFSYINIIDTRQTLKRIKHFLIAKK